MLYNSDIAGLCSRIYDQPGAFDKIIEVERVYIGIKVFPDCVAVIGRGTANLMDGVRDLEGIALISTPDIGLVPMGFNIGIPHIYPQITPLLDRPVVFAGHSLGAAHVAQLGGKWLAAGNRIANGVLFGCPTPGGHRLKYLWEGTDLTNFRNLDDPITSVPFLPCLTHLRDFTQLSVKPRQFDPLGLIAPHRMEYYRAGVENFTGVLST